MFRKEVNLSILFVFAGEVSSFSLLHKMSLNCVLQTKKQPTLACILVFKFTGAGETSQWNWIRTQKCFRTLLDLEATGLTIHSQWTLTFSSAFIITMSSKKFNAKKNYEHDNNEMAFHLMYYVDDQRQRTASFCLSFPIISNDWLLPIRIILSFMSCLFLFWWISLHDGTNGVRLPFFARYF